MWLLFPWLLPKPQFNSNKTLLFNSAKTEVSCSSIFDFSTVMYNWNTIWFMDLIESLIFDFFERTPWRACCADLKRALILASNYYKLWVGTVIPKSLPKPKYSVSFFMSDIELDYTSSSSTIYSQIRQARYQFSHLLIIYQVKTKETITVMVFGYLFLISKDLFISPFSP